MKELVGSLESLDDDRRRLAYERLWLELTIAGRALWSDPALSDAQKLDGLKWLNEIQHRVWGAHASRDGYAPEDLVATIGSHIENAPYIGGHVSACMRKAIAHATKA